MLAAKLDAYKGKKTIVLALPRGGVVVGCEIAKQLDAALDIIAVRKIGYPENPEFAVCAVDEKGTLLCDPMQRSLIDKKYLKEETERQQNEAKRRSKVYRIGRGPLPLAGRIVILTDDGIATGLTMRLAVRSVKAQSPKKIIVAVPVAPEEVASIIKKEVDEFVVLEPPEGFLGAVGAHYLDFAQVEDDEVIELMKEVR